ncbi:hypothetical protein PF005_g22425 [Phytophthora fragariae]|uniref:Uncharacterized protein n=1 Tax=Phytophthora fragariae TaxID=53985 RepID=A0A6A3E329_9STRA|nr:hypothetical protein PF003_g34991 [Phytophthora fragariae]KAE8926141.1 hypothetical protein PF009_g23664 [Phytophthora fragariae]KAE8984119.1 hypothetical protein PF011_g20903 [Phytophthora fragariae]KAE9099805.1 hypothetical protein PF006_g23053 [Phytophthora fragariae]KAE9182589.1 hypothetical protein PF005_g22425 [Phytophthora fragariae]
MEVSPVKASSGDREQKEQETAEASESEESLEEKPSLLRKRYLPVEVKTPRRSARARKKPTRLEDFVSTVLSSSASSTATMKIQVPKSWEEMMASTRTKK